MSSDAANAARTERTDFTNNHRGGSMKGNDQHTSGADATRTEDRVPLIPEFLVAQLGDNWDPAHVQTAVQMLAGGKLRFPPGVRAIPPGMVGAVERARLISAMLETVAEHGWRDSTIDEVVVRCDVTRKVLYAHFTGVDELYLASLDVVISCLRTRLDAVASRPAEPWQERLRVILAELLRFVSEEPDAACALLVEARRAGPPAIERLDNCLEHFEQCLDVQLRQAHAAEVPTLTVPGLVGGVASVLYARIARGETATIQALLPDLMYLMMVPYVGHAAALAEMTRVASR